MKRIWALAAGSSVALLILLALGNYGGTRLLLTASLPVGAGIVASFLPGEKLMSRGAYLFVGALVGGLGYAIGALFMTDDAVGLVIGAIIPSILLAFITMWSRRYENMLAAMLGAGAVTGVYAYQFNLDPQSLNVSLILAYGWTVLPLGFGFVAGVIVRLFVGEDAKVAAKDEAKAVEAAQKATVTA